jgi:hypothetical protein
MSIRTVSVSSPFGLFGSISISTAAGFSVFLYCQKEKQMNEMNFEKVKSNDILVLVGLARSFSKFKSGTSTTRQMANAMKKTIKIMPK